MVVAVASFLAYSYFKIKNPEIVGTAPFLRSSLRGFKVETSCREILFKAVFCEMVPTPYKLLNVLSFETYLKIVSFRLLENQTY